MNSLLKFGILFLFTSLLFTQTSAQPGKDEPTLYLGEAAPGESSTRSDTLLSIRTAGSSVHNPDYVITSISLSTPSLGGGPIRMRAGEKIEGAGYHSQASALIGAARSNLTLTFQVDVIYKGKLRMKLVGEYTLL